jgi:hypothetical protein
MKPRIDALYTAPVGCILVVTQLINPANALASDLLVITLAATPSMANIRLQSKDDTPRIFYEDLQDSSVLEPFESFLNPKEPHCPVLAASEGLSCSIASLTPQIYLEDARPIFSPSDEELICGTIDNDQAGSVHTAVSSSRKSDFPPLGV